MSIKKGTYDESIRKLLWTLRTTSSMLLQSSMQIFFKPSAKHKIGSKPLVINGVIYGVPTIGLLNGKLVNLLGGFNPIEKHMQIKTGSESFPQIIRGEKFQNNIGNHHHPVFVVHPF